MNRDMVRTLIIFLVLFASVFCIAGSPKSYSENSTPLLLSYQGRIVLPDLEHLKTFQKISIRENSDSCLESIMKQLTDIQTSTSASNARITCFSGLIAVFSTVVAFLSLYFGFIREGKPVVAISSVILKKPDKSKNLALFLRLQLHNKGAKALVITNVLIELKVEKKQFELKPLRTLDWRLFSSCTGAVALPFSPFPILVSGHSSYTSDEHICFETMGDPGFSIRDNMINIVVRLIFSKGEEKKFRFSVNPDDLTNGCEFIRCQETMEGEK